MKGASRWLEAQAPAAIAAAAAPAHMERATLRFMAWFPSRFGATKEFVLVPLRARGVGWMRGERKFFVCQLRRCRSRTAGTPEREPAASARLRRAYSQGKRPIFRGPRLCNSAK